MPALLLTMGLGTVGHASDPPGKGEPWGKGGTGHVRKRETGRVKEEYLLGMWQSQLDQEGYVFGRC